ncbi:MAG: hypothetical protein DME95_02035 [Verrucomicrobia bacterium]|nr:MAG: hypothetical protein DME95_02035 [Verrucomicrobiota bacterium]
MLVSASRRNDLFLVLLGGMLAKPSKKIRDREDALASTRDACATPNMPFATRFSSSVRIKLSAPCRTHKT